MSQSADNTPAGEPQPPHLQTEGWFDPGPKNAQLIYILYFVSILVGLTALVGVILAYMNRGKAGGYVESHYTWLIRTFWMGLLFSFVAAILIFIGIGFLLFLAIFVWLVIRMIKGIQALGRGEPIANPQSWWI